MTTQRQAVSLIKQPRRVLDGPTAEGLTRDQLQGRRCWRGTECEPPYAPAGHAYTRAAEPGAPLGWAVVVCPRHSDDKSLPRFVAARMTSSDPYPRLWAVWDRDSGTWVENGGDIERYALRESAEAWLAGRRYLDEFGGR